MQDLMMKFHDCLTDADREACLPAIERLIRLSNICRAYGILPLEAEAANEECIFMKTGLKLIIDGRNPEAVAQILRSLILAGDFHGTALLRRLIIAEGILSIQNGENTQFLVLRLGAMLGEQYLKCTEELAARPFDATPEDTQAILNLNAEALRKSQADMLANLEKELAKGGQIINLHKFDADN